jgi:hypothetical protein
MNVTVGVVLEHGKNRVDVRHETHPVIHRTFMWIPVIIFIAKMSGASGIALIALGPKKSRMSIAILSRYFFTIISILSLWIQAP